MISLNCKKRIESKAQVEKKTAPKKLNNKAEHNKNRARITHIPTYMGNLRVESYTFTHTFAI